MDKLTKIFNPEPVDYLLLLAYYKHKYGKTVKPVNRRSEKAAVSETTVCPRCGAPHQYIYKNNGSKGQHQCKVCRELFNKTNIYNRPIALRYPYCGHIIFPNKALKFIEDGYSAYPLASQQCKIVNRWDFKPLNMKLSFSKQIFKTKRKNSFYSKKSDKLTLSD